MGYIGDVPDRVLFSDKESVPEGAVYSKDLPVSMLEDVEAKKLFKDVPSAKRSDLYNVQ